MLLTTLESKGNGKENRTEGLEPSARLEGRAGPQAALSAEGVSGGSRLHFPVTIRHRTSNQAMDLESRERDPLEAPEFVPRIDVSQIYRCLTPTILLWLKNKGTDGPERERRGPIPFSAITTSAASKMSTIPWPMCLLLGCCPVH